MEAGFFETGFFEAVVAPGTSSVWPATIKFGLLMPLACASLLTVVLKRAASAPNVSPR